MKAETHIHESHPDIVKRLKRAEGHIRRVISMFEEGRPCLDLAQQLHAVEKAIAEAKRQLIHDHVDHCLDVAALLRRRVECATAHWAAAGRESCPVADHQRG